MQVTMNNSGKLNVSGLKFILMHVPPQSCTRVETGL